MKKKILFLLYALAVTGYLNMFVSNVVNRHKD